MPIACAVVLKLAADGGQKAYPALPAGPTGLNRTFGSAAIGQGRRMALRSSSQTVSQILVLKSGSRTAINPFLGSHPYAEQAEPAKTITGVIETSDVVVTAATEAAAEVEPPDAAMIAAEVALPFLRPLISLTVDPQQEYIDTAKHLLIGGKLLAVMIGADRVLADDLADEAGLLKRFPSRDLSWLQATNRPALRNDPTPRLARREK